MTISEASQLIMQAAVLGSGGEIYVLDMGEPVKITYLAEQLIRLSGKEPGRDIQIVYTGLRPGEKLFEELFSANCRKIVFSELAQDFKGDGDRMYTKINGITHVFCVTHRREHYFAQIAVTFNAVNALFNQRQRIMTLIL